MKLPFFIALIFAATLLQANFSNDNIAPNFNVTDLNGVEYELYDILASGKNVIIDFSTTTCGPCWDFHKTGILDELYHEFGPDGKDELMVFLIESNQHSTIDDLYGTGENTLGNWVEGTSYPIIDQFNINRFFRVSGFPALVQICQDRRYKSVFEMTLQGIEFGKKSILECPDINYASRPYFEVDINHGCENLQVQFMDDSWPPPTSYLWDFGDGQNSTKASPTHNYAQPGEYQVNLRVSNEFGGHQTSDPTKIWVGKEASYEFQQIGIKDTIAGEGKFYEGIGGALIFDVHDEILLESVKVYSQHEGERVISLFDGFGNQIYKRIINIPIGESRVLFNFLIPKGVNFKLEMNSVANLYRNSAGVNYPYTIDGLVSIHTSNAYQNQGNYYYFFYDWNVRKAGCIGSAYDHKEETPKIILSPNPALDQIVIDVEKYIETEVTIFDAYGRNVLNLEKSKFSRKSVDISYLSKGFYFVHVFGRVEKFIKL